MVPMSDDTADEGFQLAHRAARRLTRQCRAHVETSLSRLDARRIAAASYSPYGLDRHAAREGEHGLAYRKRLEHVEAMSNALQTHLRGVELLLEHETFHALPLVTIARAMAEVSASCSWLLRPATADARAARAYALIFRDIEKSISRSRGKTATTLAELREKLIEEVERAGGKIQRRNKDGKMFDDVHVVRVKRAHAKTGFNYSDRVAEEIPSVAPMYSAMSALVHGEPLAVSVSLDDPAIIARTIGFVVQQSTATWSQAIHAWVGVDAAPFINDQDVRALKLSIPKALRDQLEAERPRGTHGSS